MILRVRHFLLASGIVALLAGLVWLLLPPLPLYPKTHSWSQIVLDREGAAIRVTLTEDEKIRLHYPLSEISPHLTEATLLHEDQHFWRHFGINPISLVRSAFNLILPGARRTGGSTITMQLARLRGPLRTRSIPGKLVQIVHALRLERHHPKEAILEAYLNLAPYGGNLEGIGAASHLYLGKSPSEISRREAVTLSVIPQSPARRTPPRDQRANPELAAAQARLYRRLQAKLGIPRDPLDEAFVVRRIAQRPFTAPHLARRLLKQSPEAASNHTFLDAERQAMLEDCITRHLELEREQGLTNACALLVDHTSMEVLAYVGSANFWDTTIHGQVDGITMRRSPGSTLKPFIYALAMEQGLIHPYSLLKDTRLRYGDGYAPENFDRAYQGPLSAKEALQRSRNVPAVSLANDLRQPTLYQFLQRASVTLPHSAEHYGLSLALGGAEVSLEELVRLYAMLPNQGAIQSLRFQPHEFPRPRQILAPEATFLTLTMMENIPAPGASRLLGRSAEAPVYWKTGTSHGFRDAWAIAVFDHYVLGVWIGDFPGGSRANYVAREATAPLLFDMIGALRDHGDASESFRAQPHGSRLRKVDLCSLTGQKPSPHCPSSRKGWFIPGVSPITRCDVHQVLLIDTASGLRLRPDQATPERACHWETFECWPSDLLTLYRQAGLPRRTPPPYLSPRQESTALTRSPSFAGGRGGALRILSPRPGTPYTLEPGRSAIPLQALAPADCQEVYWFANRSFLGSAPPTEPFLWEDAPLGQHQLRAVDDEGRVSETTLLVKAAPRSSP